MGAYLETGRASSATGYLTLRGRPVSFWERGDEARLASKEVIRIMARAGLFFWLCSTLHKRPSPRKQAFYTFSKTVDESRPCPLEKRRSQPSERSTDNDEHKTI
jgi:hypothetical protein